jgi:hypothetical protein
MQDRNESMGLFSLLYDDVMTPSKYGCWRARLAVQCQCGSWGGGK